jgi:pimeloyl-ACP methyl ester carboxylesterase
MKKTLQIGQRRVTVEMSGRQNGRPLLLLHGWGGDRLSWQPLTEALDKEGLLEHFCALTVDFPGFGESEEPEEPWSVGDYAHFLEELLRRLYQEMNWSGDYDLIVHSFGGRVALKMLSPDFQHEISQRPDKLVLVAAAGIKRKPSPRVRIAAVAARMGKGLMRFPLLQPLSKICRKILYRALRTHDYEKSSGVMRSTFLKVIDEDLKDTLDHVKNPTLIFWGKKDSYVPLRDGMLMRDKIPGSRLVVIEDGKHGIHKTKASLLAREITTFLTAHHDG